MISRTGRAVLNAAGVLVLAWMGYVVYGFFTDSGPWRVVERALSSDYMRPSPAAVFATCLLPALLPLLGLIFLVLRVSARSRAPS